MKLICIGKIVNTKGLKGELRVISDTDFKTERYASKNTVYIEMDNGYDTVQIESFQVQRGYDLLRFKGFDDINLVEKYKGKNIFVENMAIALTEPGHYHINDILGLKIVQGGVVVGVVETVREFPQGDYLVVKKNEGKTALVPFVDELIIDVDLQAKTITVVELEGLI